MNAEKEARERRGPAAYWRWGIRASPNRPNDTFKHYGLGIDILFWINYNSIVSHKSWEPFWRTFIDLATCAWVLATNSQQAPLPELSAYARVRPSSGSPFAPNGPS